MPDPTNRVCRKNIDLSIHLLNDLILSFHFKQADYSFSRRNRCSNGLALHLN